MAKSIGKFLGAGGAGTSLYGSENDIVNYLNKYDTTQVDSANQNMSAMANRLSAQLSSRPGYVYSISASPDEAKRVENATYQNVVNMITPQFDSQRRQLETRLQNQGLSVNSEAYQNAMNNLNQQQANAYGQAAYNSIQAGQNAYSTSLNNQIAAGNFQNSAQMLPINEILNLLQNSKSGYDVAMDKYDITSQADKRTSENRTYNNQSQNSLGLQTVGNIVNSIFQMKN